MEEKIISLIIHLEEIIDSYKEDIEKLKEEYKSISRFKTAFFEKRKIIIKEEVNEYLVVVSTLRLVILHIKSL